MVDVVTVQIKLRLVCSLQFNISQRQKYIQVLQAQFLERVATRITK